MQLVRRAAYAFGRRNRRRKANFALSVIERLGVESVLLVGVSGWPSPVMNRVESTLMRRVPYAVACGVDEDASGWPRFVLADGRRLPFRTDAFDLVYANAVVEHVGEQVEQQRFMDEVARVGRAWIVTTPNRWFPVEAHYHTFFSHWRGDWCPRGTVTRLLGVRDLRELAPRATIRGIPVLSPTITALGPSAVTQAGARRLSSSRRTWPHTAPVPATPLACWEHPHAGSCSMGSRQTTFAAFNDWVRDLGGRGVMVTDPDRVPADDSRAFGTRHCYLVDPAALPSAYETLLQVSARHGVAVTIDQRTSGTCMVAFLAPPPDTGAIVAELHLREEPGLRGAPARFRRTQAGQATSGLSNRRPGRRTAPRVVPVVGPDGAGKTTLIRELTTPSSEDDGGANSFVFKLTFRETGLFRFLYRLSARASRRQGLTYSRVMNLFDERHPHLVLLVALVRWPALASRLTPPETGGASRVTLVDRYFWDYMVTLARPRRRARRVSPGQRYGRALPPLDRAVVLTTPSATLRGRKDVLSVEAVELLYRHYCEQIERARTGRVLLLPTHVPLERSSAELRRFLISE